MNKEDPNIIQRTLDAENEKQFDILRSNISEMKHVALELRTHMQEEKSDLDNLQKGYDSADKLVEFTIKKVGELANSPAGRMSCYLCLLVLVFFIILYFL